MTSGVGCGHGKQHQLDRGEHLEGCEGCEGPEAEREQVDADLAAFPLGVAAVR